MALPTYTVTYNANGGLNAPEEQIKTQGVNLSLSKLKPTRTGHTFLYWNTEVDGSGTTYYAGTAYLNDVDLQLYAQWEVMHCVILYNANGGSGAPAQLEEVYGTTINLSSIKPSRKGYTFVGWSNDIKADTASYHSGDTFIVESNMTLYAVWKQNSVVLKTTEQISLDFYNQAITTVTTKQLDTESRYINVTCTDHGKKVLLSNESMSAYIRYKKNDGTFIFNDAEITDEGTALITLTQQMTSIAGRHSVDLMITSLAGISASKLMDMDSIYTLGATVISTMQFYLNVVSSALDDDKITSTSEFNALRNALNELNTIKTAMNALDKSLNENEEVRQTAEAERISKEEERITNEELRQDDLTGETYRIVNEEARKQAETKREERVQNTIDSCKKQISDTIDECNSRIDQKIENSEERIATAVSNAESATEKANISASNADTATAKCISATTGANAAIEEFKTIKDQSGIIKQEEKGSANGIATLDENGTIPAGQLDLSSFIANNLTTENEGLILDARQGKTLDDAIKALQQAVKETINGLQKIYFNDTVDDSIGKDGDILMVPIK